MNYVLYHANCYDGFGAAWAAWKYYGDKAQYIPVTHGEDPPTEIFNAETVTIVDFSYSREVLLEIYNDWNIKELMVLDHHKTAQAELEGLPFAHFDMTKSGAIIAWEYWHPHEDVPELLLYVQDRDLWRFELPHSREVAAAMRLYQMNFETWNRLETALPFLKTEGQTVLKFTQSQVEMMCKQARMTLIGGYDVPKVNATSLWSEIGEYLLAEYPAFPFVASWFQQADGRFKWSLRSRSDFDVSQIALLYGGGGHAQAAGFITEELL